MGNIYTITQDLWDAHRGAIGTWMQGAAPAGATPTTDDMVIIVGPASATVEDTVEKRADVVPSFTVSAATPIGPAPFVGTPAPSLAAICTQGFTVPVDGALWATATGPANQYVQIEHASCAPADAFWGGDPGLPTSTQPSALLPTSPTSPGIARPAQTQSGWKVKGWCSTDGVNSWNVINVAKNDAIRASLPPNFQGTATVHINMFVARQAEPRAMKLQRSGSLPPMSPDEIAPPTKSYTDSTYIYTVPTRTPLKWNPTKHIWEDFGTVAAYFSGDVNAPGSDRGWYGV